ncbi:MAG: ATP synthase F0 subunit C [Acidobacteria bacterium]|nr:ATP synthase F0 subunit C [Acidobacteriota bacterium]
MRKAGLTLLMGWALLVFAAPAFAQEEPAAPAGDARWLIITSGFAMAFAAGICGLAQSRALTAACDGVARNPGAADIIRVFLFLGLAFIEFLALLTFVVTLILKYG